MGDLPNAIVSQNTSLLPIISNTSNMSDAFRQSTTDKATSALKPDSQKSGLEQAGDSIKNTADNVAGSVQPSGEKGMGRRPLTPSPAPTTTPPSRARASSTLPRRPSATPPSPPR